MRRRRLWLGAAALGVAALVAWSAIRASLSDAFAQGPTEGAFRADASCPEFKATCRTCEVAFGSRGLSTLNSFHETFVGEGAFEIGGFEVESLPGGRFNITAESNRGPIRSEIHADRLVRLGQDREDEAVLRTHQSAFCDAGRIDEHQVGYVGGGLNVQDLEFWGDGDALRFRLFQNRSPVADVACQP